MSECIGISPRKMTRIRRERLGLGGAILDEVVRKDLPMEETFGQMILSMKIDCDKLKSSIVRENHTMFTSSHIIPWDSSVIHG